ncbi:MAG: hypothetical protein KME40_14625 [Komarekiella atlantica HA4396-MV6]|jgi:hypothetical protein|nr:hypothetical protein [Komarekiella atlantica HA4396-MV6]
MPNNTSTILKVKAAKGTVFKLDWKEKVDKLNSKHLEVGKNFSVLFIRIYEDERSQNELSSLGQRKSDYWKITFQKTIPTEHGDEQKTWYVFKSDVELFGHAEKKIKERLNNDKLILILLMFIFAVIIFIYLVMR